MIREIMKNQLLSALILIAFTSAMTVKADESCKPSKHAKVSSITNFTYHKARKTLIKAGWQPLQTKTFNEAAKEAIEDPDLLTGIGLVFWNKGYVEIEGCAGTGIAPCAFLFKDSLLNY